jgi:hypothetical protein
MLTGILVTCALAVNGVFDMDTIPRSWFIGFDQGLSVRYFPRSDFGLGIMLQPESGSLVNKSESKSTYYNESSTSTNAGSNERKDDSKGARVLVEGLYCKKLSRPFTLTSFVNAGGGYEKYFSESTYSYKNSDVDTLLSYHNSKRKGTQKTFTASVGIMPGITLGRFLFQFRLGLSGVYTKESSPDYSGDKADGESKNMRLIYPSELVRALMVHIDI